jgi:hypothetical protein
VSPVTAPARPIETLAHRESGCPLCLDPIHRGDPIRPTTKALGWVHTRCAKEFFEVYPEKAEEAA